MYVGCTRGAALRFLDGPKFANWLTTHVPLDDPVWQTYPTWRDRLRHWRLGDPVRPETADQILSILGLSLQRVPESFFFERQRYAKIPPQDRERALKQYAAGRSPREIADEIGCSPDTVSHWVFKAGISRQRGGRTHGHDPALIQRAIELYRQGRSYAEIQDETGLSYGTFGAALKRAGLTGKRRPGPRKRGSRSIPGTRGAAG